MQEDHDVSHGSVVGVYDCPRHGLIRHEQADLAQVDYATCLIRDSDVHIGLRAVPGGIDRQPMYGSVVGRQHGRDREATGGVAEGFRGHIGYGPVQVRHHGHARCGDAIPVGICDDSLHRYASVEPDLHW